MKELNSVGWFEIYVQDMARAKDFYEKVFTCSLQKVDMEKTSADKTCETNNDVEMWTFPKNDDVYGASGALVKMNGFESGNNSTVVYFNSTDCSEEASRVEEAGGKIFKPKFSIGSFGFIAIVSDTEGNMIGIHSCV